MTATNPNSKLRGTSHLHKIVKKNLQVIIWRNHSNLKKTGTLSWYWKKKKSDRQSIPILLSKSVTGDKVQLHTDTASVEWVTRMYVTLTDSRLNVGDSYSDVSNVVWSLPTAFWFWHKKEFGSGFFLAALRGNSTVWIRLYLYLFFLNRLRLMSNKVMLNAQGWLLKITSIGLRQLQSLRK